MQEVNDIDPGRIPSSSSHIYYTFPGDYAGFRYTIIQVKGVWFGTRHDWSAHELLQNRVIKDYNDHIRHRWAILPYLV
jgi:hypothetical protein